MQAATISHSRYQFDNPTLAYYILDQLDVFEQIDVTKEELAEEYRDTTLMLKPDDDYCKKHRAFMVYYPEGIFEQKNLITSFTRGSPFRTKVLPAVGTDIQPEVTAEHTGGLYDIDVRANSFFSYTELYLSKAIGIQFSCLSQVSSAIPGNTKFSKKEYISENLKKYAKDYKSRPNCFNPDRFSQQPVANPLTINGFKFEILTYLLVASSNPVIAYYHDGKVTVSRPNQKDTSWTFKQLEEAIINEKITKKEDWLESYLKPEMKKALIHLVRMSQEHFMKKSSIYQLFGIQFVLDENLNLWLLKATTQPIYVGATKETQDIINKMLIDHYEIVFGLMKSRMKRVILYVNELMNKREIIQISSDKISINDLEEKRNEFKRITQNYFESEFEPNSENTFEPIINDNYAGKAKYFGFIYPKCL